MTVVEYQSFFENLAGRHYSDAVICRELDLAGLNYRTVPMYGECNASIDAVLGPFSFQRAWRYWVVHGPMTLHVADRLYAWDTGKVVRVAGHCAAPPPTDWATRWRGILVVDCYHVDSQEGLCEVSRVIRDIIDVQDRNADG